MRVRMSGGERWDEGELRSEVLMIMNGGQGAGCG